MSEIEKPIDYKKIAGALDGFLKKYPDTKFLVLGGSHQDEPEHYKILSDPSVIHVLKSHGMNTTAWEAPVEFQRHVDKVMWDNMDAKSFADAIGQDLQKKAGIKQSESHRSAYEMQFPLIQAQRKFGNSFIFYDSPRVSLKDHFDGAHGAYNQEKLASKLAYQKADSIWVDTYIRLQEGGMRHSEEYETRAFEQLMYGYYKTEPEIKAAHEAFLKFRISPEDEKRRAEHIKAHSVQGAVVWAGAAHGAGTGDLDEFLGAPRLILVKDRQAYNRRSQEGFVMGEEAPEGYLIVSEGKIVSGDDAYKAAATFSAKYHMALKGTTSQVAPEALLAGIKENQPVTIKP